MSGFLGASARIQTKLPTQQKGNKKRGYPRLDRNILSYLKKKAATYSPALQAVPSA